MSKIINFARLQVGKPYVFGRSGMDAYDCSGLTKRAVAQIGLDFFHAKRDGVVHNPAVYPADWEAA